ncbi:DUF6153 family protein [Streptomyces odonnellii]|uniref:DUF6153 family protein n=1 Tax=Streptomyces odonnellii TaxID=1417980 RepID=UPI00062562F4|nr:DUF6153 family protein [Streptomyces odonnellii]
MRRPPRGLVRPARVRALLLLVLTLAAGVLAMHGLAPVPPAASSTAAPPTAHVMPDGARDCVQPGHEDGGHLDHADGLCAAAGTSTGPALSTLAASGLPSGLADPATGPRQASGAASAGPAPPSLSELQLLRI